MKCVSQANNYSRLSQQPNAPASMAATEGSTAVKDNKTNDKDYGNVSLLHLAKVRTVSLFLNLWSSSGQGLGALSHSCIVPNKRKP